MLQIFQQTIEKHGLLRPGRHVLVAVSGGSDSVALACALSSLGRKYRIKITLAHLNHRIRGRAADEDARFVKRLADRLRVGCVQRRIDVPRMARGKGISLEMAARDARYGFFRQAMRATGADCLATGHTSDDQAETVLLRLVRGTGPQGLGGIAYKAERQGMQIIRPLLDVTHAQVIEYLRKNKTSWREDASNRDRQFLRNRIRLEILPLLEKRLNPGVRNALVRFAKVFSEEHRWMDGQARDHLAHRLRSKTRKRISLSGIKHLPLALQRRIVLRWLVLNDVDPERINFEAIESVVNLMTSSKGTGSVALGDGWSVVRKYKVAELTAENESSAVFPPVVMNVPGETILPERGLHISARFRPGLIKQRGLRVGMIPARASFDAARTRTAALVIRSWKPGDRIRPLGMKGTKKIQDLFVDAKIPRAQRSTVPVFECDGDIIWIPGYCVAQGWEVKRRDRPSLQLVVSRTRPGARTGHS